MTLEINNKGKEPAEDNESVYSYVTNLAKYNETVFCPHLKLPEWQEEKFKNIYTYLQMLEQFDPKKNLPQNIVLNFLPEKPKEKLASLLNNLLVEDKVYNNRHTPRTNDLPGSNDFSSNNPYSFDYNSDSTSYKDVPTIVSDGYSSEYNSTGAIDTDTYTLSFQYDNTIGDQPQEAKKRKSTINYSKSGEPPAILPRNDSKSKFTFTDWNIYYGKNNYYITNHDKKTAFAMSKTNGKTYKI